MKLESPPSVTAESGVANGGSQQRVVMRRVWAMPSADTFDIPVIADFVKWRLKHSKCSIDPYARNKRWATYTNDLNPATAAEHHMDAEEFLSMLVNQGVTADLVILDPPYSPRQIKDCYDSIGMTPTESDCQISATHKRRKALIEKLVPPGGVVLKFGWNTGGMGKGWTQEEILLVCHGGNHNDTICTAERRDQPERDFFAPHNDRSERPEAKQ